MSKVDAVRWAMPNPVFSPSDIRRAPRSAEQLDQRDHQPDDAGCHDPQLPVQQCLQITDVGLQFGPNVGNLGSHFGNIGSDPGDVGFRFGLDFGDLRLDAGLGFGDVDSEAASEALVSALVATLPPPMVSTKASASGSAAPASQRAFTARCVSKASALMQATVRRRGPGRERQRPEWRRAVGHSLPGECLSPSEGATHVSPERPAGDETAPHT